MRRLEGGSYGYRERERPRRWAHAWLEAGRRARPRRPWPGAMVRSCRSIPPAMPMTCSRPPTAPAATRRSGIISGYGPFPDEAAFAAWLAERARLHGPAVLRHPRWRRRDAPWAWRAICRIVPADGVIEIGHIWLAPALQRTRLATEAIFLMARHAFETLGNRRFEWKCNALNAPSRRAAIRFGFTFEGLFRQHMIVKGRNRDTAWYAMIDRDWPAIRQAFEAWLDPGNFDAEGRQRRPLAARDAAGPSPLARPVLN